MAFKYIVKRGRFYWFFFFFFIDVQRFFFLCTRIRSFVHFCNSEFRHDTAYNFVSVFITEVFPGFLFASSEGFGLT